MKYTIPVSEHIRPHTYRHILSALEVLEFPGSTFCEAFAAGNSLTRLDALKSIAGLCAEVELARRAAPAVYADRPEELAAFNAALARFDRAREGFKYSADGMKSRKELAWAEEHAF